MFRRLYDWMMKMAEHPKAVWAMSLVSFAESSFFPLPPDMMLIPMVLAKRAKAFIYASYATVSSVLGGILGYAIGYFLFDMIGQPVLNFLGISLPAFRIAGGLLLFLMALEMLFEKRAARREKNVEQSSAEHEEADDPHDDQWVFPLGTPLIAGPGAIASIILLMGNAPQGISGQIVIIGVLFAVIALTLVLFLIAGKLGRFLNPTATRAMSRILGMILAALAVQFVLTGLSSAGFGG